MQSDPDGLAKPRTEGHDHDAQVTQAETTA
jgi:hypothetical protein